MLSGTLLYLIPPGLVRIGKNLGNQSPSKNLDIILDGPLVRPLHWLVYGSLVVQWFEEMHLLGLFVLSVCLFHCLVHVAHFLSNFCCFVIHGIGKKCLTFVFLHRLSFTNACSLSSFMARY